MGSRGGSPQVTLSTQQLPSHSHGATSSLQASTAADDSTDPTGRVLATPNRGIYNTQAPNATMAAGAITTTVAATGNGSPHDNMPPYRAMNYIIALQGIFPSRS